MYVILSSTRLSGECTGLHLPGNGGDVKSSPYQRDFGFRELDREYEFGDSPDGSALSAFRHALGVG